MHGFAQCTQCITPYHYQNVQAILHLPYPLGPSPWGNWSWLLRMIPRSSHEVQIWSHLWLGPFYKACLHIWNKWLYYILRKFQLVEERKNACELAMCWIQFSAIKELVVKAIKSIVTLDPHITQHIQSIKLNITSFISHKVLESRGNGLGCLGHFLSKNMTRAKKSSAIQRCSLLFFLCSVSWDGATKPEQEQLRARSGAILSPHWHILLRNGALFFRPWAPWFCSRSTLFLPCEYDIRHRRVSHASAMLVEILGPWHTRHLRLLEVSCVLLHTVTLVVQKTFSS